MSRDRNLVAEKVQEAIFSQLLNQPANLECADCCNKSPTWVSLDFGVFLCIRCSGVHRQLGPHITRVRSTRLDGWQKENIEIMASVGNRIANDYYENNIPTGYRKPTANSTPEECRRFVDDKYIKKRFAVANCDPPVKEFLRSREQGTTPDFGYSTGNTQSQNQKPEARTSHSSSENRGGFVRKKSLSLDKFPKDVAKKGDTKEAPTNHHQGHTKSQNVDLLNQDMDLLGGDSNNDFGDFKQAHTQSASPGRKVNFEDFKKVNAQQKQQNQTQGQGQQQGNHWNWDFNATQTSNQNGTNNNGFDNGQSNQQTQNQGQQNQSDSKVDLMKLYNQPQVMHQNHFMPRGMQPWNAIPNQTWNNGMNQGFNNMGGMNQVGFQQNYNQGLNPNMNYNPQMNMNMMNAVPNYGSNIGYGQAQHTNNPYQANGFVQAPNGNKFF